MNCWKAPSKKKKMVFYNSENIKKEKFAEILQKINFCGHEYREGFYETQTSRLTLFCPKHKKLYETTFSNYKRSRVGMPCCAAERKSNALKSRVFSDSTREKMSQAALVRPTRKPLYPLNWRRCLEYREWEKQVRLNYGTCCVVTGKTSNIVLHHLQWGLKERYNPNNGIPLWAPIHKLFHDTFGYKKPTRSNFLFFLQTKKLYLFLKTFDMPISSQGQQECWQGSETRVYHPERVMKLHERLASGS